MDKKGIDLELEYIKNIQIDTSMDLYNLEDLKVESDIKLEPIKSKYEDLSYTSVKSFLLKDIERNMKKIDSQLKDIKLKDKELSLNDIDLKDEKLNIEDIELNDVDIDNIDINLELDDVDLKLLNIDVDKDTDKTTPAPCAYQYSNEKKAIKVGDIKKLESKSTTKPISKSDEKTNINTETTLNDKKITKSEPTPNISLNKITSDKKDSIINSVKKTDITPLAPYEAEIKNNLENTKSDDVFDITGGDHVNKKDNDNKKGKTIFKIIIPILSLAAVAIIIFTVNLFTIYMKKDSSKDIAKANKKLSLNDIGSGSISRLDGQANSEDAITATDEATLESLDDAEKTATDNDNLLDNDDTKKTAKNNSETEANESTKSNEDNGIYTTTVIETISSPTTAYYTSSDSFFSSNDIAVDIARDYNAVPKLYQNDIRWGNEPFAGQTIAHYGSGPTCLSMVYAFYKKDCAMTPAKMAELCTSQKYVANNSGATTSFLTTGAANLGLKYKEVPKKTVNLDANISSGLPMIAYLYADTLAFGRHYVVIHSSTKDSYIINDPGSEEKSQKEWPKEDFLKKIDKLWVYTSCR